MDYNCIEKSNNRNRSEIKGSALRRLTDAGQAKRVAAIYAGVTLGLSALVTILGLVLDGMMSGTKPPMLYRASESMPSLAMIRLIDSIRSSLIM